MSISIPELSLVVLVGASGSGKSTFARRLFKSTEVISSDFCRALIADDENDQSVTAQAFELLHAIAAKRLQAGRLTVIDATNVQPEARKPLVALAREYHVVPVALVFDLPEGVCQDRNRERQDRQLPAGAVHRQVEQLRRGLRGLQKEGFRYVFILKSPGEADAAVIERQRLWTDRRDQHGPFDIIGDLHGCCDELEALLETLGYVYREEPGTDTYHRTYSHPQGRTAIFLGDLVDRGPRILDTVQLVMRMVRSGAALCVPGNHDAKLVRKLNGREVLVTHGLEQTLTELYSLPVEHHQALKREITEFLDGLISHYVLDDSRLVVAHGGMKESMQGRASGRVRDFALYGETTGETDEFGLPVRYNWAAEYRGKARVVYGHTPVVQPEWLNHTINIDTGCVYGGRLTALRYPELELVSVPAHRVYSEPVRPLAPVQEELTAQQRQDDLLDIGDVLGKHIVETRWMGRVTIPEGNSAAALEVMSRFIVNPKWLVYLPPTMSPPESTSHPGLLEYPAEAFAYYRKHGVTQVVCEQKHMGSRLVAVVCKDEDVALRRFGVAGEGSGILYTRTGRRFFADPAIETALLDQLRAAMAASGLWQELATDWIVLDCELMPWSVKAQDLLQTQYAAVGAAAQASLGQVIAQLEAATGNGLPAGELLKRFQSRATMMGRYIDAYRRYCWPVHLIEELRLAPFHIMASEGTLHTDKDHTWHMLTIGRMVRSIPDSSLYSTPFQLVDLSDPESEEQATAWWEALTQGGGEGMVIKPLEFIAHEGRKLLQPAVKCRGREYLRIIYGPEYTTPEHLAELRQRSVTLKRTLALREFALGIEALERFVDRQPLRRVHEAVFGVLALESEPVDPRL